MSAKASVIDPVSFLEQGFVVLPRLLDEAEVETFTRHLENRSGRRRSDLEAAGNAAAARSGKNTGLTGWTVPDGVTRYEEFWPLLLHRRLVSAVRALLGPAARFLQHTDLHVGFSSFNWHRDSVARRFGVGADWDESLEPYRVLRVGFYLQSPQSSGFRFGLVPGTHRPPLPGGERVRRRIERAAGAWGHAARVLSGRNPEPPTTVWVSAAAGDAVVFDPRVLHTGSPVDGAKYSVFVAYGVPNHHYVNHWYYYRHLRPDLDYRDPPPALVDALRDAGLYHEPRPPERPPDGAWIPGGRLNALAKRLRFA